MIASVKDLASSGSDVEASTNTWEYLEACNLLFEQGMLSRHRRNNKNSPVVGNIRKGMAFFNSGVLVMRKQVISLVGYYVVV